tara:strand:+ start:160 stop:411 length:252 start_codon:yes stop_codon:yes gene_type:complete
LGNKLQNYLKLPEITGIGHFIPQGDGNVRVEWREDKIGVKPVQEEKFVEISTPTFFPVFTGNLREKRNFFRFLQIPPLAQCLP